MLRLAPTFLLLAVAAFAQSAPSEQQRAYEQHRRTVEAQRRFGEISGFHQTSCLNCGVGPENRLSERSKASFVSVTTLAAPKKARSAFLKAERALLESPQRVDRAEVALRIAVESYPNHAAAWALLGKIESATGRRDEARASFHRAVEADPAFLDPHVELARFHLEDGDWPALEASARQIARTNPYFTLGHLYLGVARLNQDDAEQAEKHAVHALATEDVLLFPEVHHLLGQAYEKLGDRRRAAEHFRAYVAQPKPQGPLRASLADRIHQLETR